MLLNSLNYRWRDRPRQVWWNKGIGGPDGPELQASEQRCFVLISDNDLGTSPADIDEQGFCLPDLDTTRDPQPY